MLVCRHTNGYFDKRNIQSEQPTLEKFISTKRSNCDCNEIQQTEEWNYVSIVVVRVAPVVMGETINELQGSKVFQTNISVSSLTALLTLPLSNARASVFLLVRYQAVQS